MGWRSKAIYIFNSIILLFFFFGFDDVSEGYPAKKAGDDKEPYDSGFETVPTPDVVGVSFLFGGDVVVADEKKYLKKDSGAP